jgi:hypothetical protein
MIRILTLALFPMLLACETAATGPLSTCEALCGELVTECAYDAYPSMDSCMQGCNHLAETGAGVDARLACVQAAQCDTFAVVACERTATAAPQR